VAVGLFKPYVIMVAPVYVYLPKNLKFVAVKAPLGFFTSDELSKLTPFDSFYLPQFVDSVLPFQKAGESIRELFRVRQQQSMQSNQGAKQVTLPVSSFEMNDSVIRLVGPLWSEGIRIEPFFLGFFANEICGAFTKETLSLASDQSVEKFELAFLRSSCAVFLALHIGLCEPELLKTLRHYVFHQTLSGDSPSAVFGEVGEIANLSVRLVPDLSTKEITLTSLKACPMQAARKILGRLTRVEADLIPYGTPMPSIYGENGIAHE